MCLLALFYRVIDNAPVVVGANREEQYARRGEPPQILDGRLRCVAGVDPVGGGTWLGVNECGLIVAVTNRQKSRVPDRPRSRGLLVRDLLALASAHDACAQAQDELGAGTYAGCNLLLVDQADAYVVHAGDWLRVRPLLPGLHILTSQDVNSTADPRLAYADAYLRQRPYGTADDCLTALKELCGQTGNGHPAMCLHGKTGGTVSSSIIALRLPPAGAVYLHAQGPPDQTPYEDYTQLTARIGLGADRAGRARAATTTPSLRT